ncbi:S-adenosylmethionine:tRNA ribosyltransferase-isomerase [Taibaiella lutea]|uniref:S-adenosylmethionine:tRNA ribosyltransferase-isomerase n=1 Tax=Taibaiella lutea TaxID=2608001 RepID=A0A5M6CMH2_9BACT|nr:S-adenosylmethionine:tRNA ribosyltransferase-isomerase [Taibaiella lutea]KAA5536206.1 S-adenosylmethionine:tRNA ribosyltransferase-isomerase [Taibaiella lutea]
MHPSLLQIKDFTYHLPDAKIARYPLSERDASRLLVFEGAKITEDVYRNLDQYLPGNTLLIFNETKVIHARLLFQKPTGAKIEVFCLEADERYPDVQTAMLQYGEVYWKCLVGGAAKWKDEQVLQLSVADDAVNDLQLKAAVAEKQQGYFILKLNWNKKYSFAEALQIAGKVPLPPYLNREADAEDKERYQTIFAQHEGSVAAPTAALHFTTSLLQRLSEKQLKTGFVTLHVGAGTFKPVKSDTMEGHDMHAEWLEASPELLQQVIKQLEQNLPVVAVGTTSSRTLESLYWLGVRLHRKDIDSLEGIAVPQWYPYDKDSEMTAIESYKAVLQYLQQQKQQKIIMRTQIIIAPGYQFRVIQGLVTNFHQPQSTLLLLVSALVGEAWREIYEYALMRDFRFLSYGDGCLLWKH